MVVCDVSFGNETEVLINTTPNPLKGALEGRIFHKDAKVVFKIYNTGRIKILVSVFLCSVNSMGKNRNADRAEKAVPKRRDKTDLIYFVNADKHFIIQFHFSNLCQGLADR